MEIAISNLPFLGLSTGSMRHLPRELGIEIFCECGNDYYWRHLIPKLMEGREGSLSVHGPFQRLDLSDPAADFEEMKAAYRWAFELCRDHGAHHCVCHPYESARPLDDTPERLEQARRTSLERVLYLTRMAKPYGVELLVENMPNARPMLDQQAFLDLFAPRPELNFLIDTGHALLRNWDMDLAFRTLGGRIKAFHLHDNLGDFDSHLIVGRGKFDWDGFFTGYTRYTPEATLVCEYNAGTIEEILESVDGIRNQISAHTPKNLSEKENER